MIWSAETLRPLFRATEPGTIPVPHRRRSAGVASGRGFLPTVLRYPEPRLPVARMVATIALKLPGLVASYPKLIDAVGKSLPTGRPFAPAASTSVGPRSARPEYESATFAVRNLSWLRHGLAEQPYELVLFEELQPLPGPATPSSGYVSLAFPWLP